MINTNELAANWWTEQIWDAIKMNPSLNKDRTIINALATFKKSLGKEITNQMLVHNLVLLSTFSKSTILEYTSFIARLSYNLLPKDFEMQITPTVVTIYDGKSIKTLYSREENTI